LLTAAAARTQTIGLATTVLLPALRGAAVTAQMLSALDQLSGLPAHGGRQLAPALGRDPSDVIPSCALGTPEQCAERIQAFADGGAQRMQLWPAAEAAAQLEAIAELVRPLLADAAAPAAERRADRADPAT
jgi:alkanesulfonate monooxygenase SsuD/methylene tetrahydromethanopterin reductase-like flavin-dependent oxidoreductase (luciferase family)